MVAGCVDRDLGIGAFQGLGADPSQQSPKRLGVGGIGRDLEDLVVLHEGITANGLSLAGDPDHVGVPAADQPPPVLFRADHRSGCLGVLELVKRHQVGKLHLPPGPDVPEAGLTFDHAVGHLREVATAAPGRKSAARRLPNPAAR